MKLKSERRIRRKRFIKAVRNLQFNLSPEMQREIYDDGFKCGYSQDGECLPPYPCGKRNQLKREAWVKGWLDGGEKWISETNAEPLTTPNPN